VIYVGASESRKRLCPAVMDDFTHSDDDDDDDDRLLDSEVSQLLHSRSQSPVLMPDRSPYKRLRQPADDCVTTSPGLTRSAEASRARALHAGIAALPRPSLDFYKMQVPTNSL